MSYPFDLGSEPDAVVTARRLDAAGAPPDLVGELHALGVGSALLLRLCDTVPNWGWLRGLMRLPHAITTEEDARAVVTMLNLLPDPETVTQWGQLGGLRHGVRLVLKNIPVEAVTRFDAPQGMLGAYLRMHLTGTRQGMHPDDLRYWHLAGVLTLTAPYVVESEWNRWRGLAVHHVGLRRAALAAAAGLTPAETLARFESGGLDVEMLRMLAGLRSPANILPKH